RQGVALRGRQLVEVVEHRSAQDMEGRVRELHLGLDPDRPRDMPAVEPAVQVLEQGALAEPGVSPDHRDLAAPGARTLEQPVEGLEFGAATEELHVRSGSGAPVRPAILPEWRGCQSAPAGCGTTSPRGPARTQGSLRRSVGLAT